MIPAGGGVLDDAGPCFKKFGDPTWWRAEAAGHDGHLWWTNAWESPSPDNWGWWRVHVEEPGEYLVETWSTVGFSVWDDVHHLIRASGVAHDVQVDPTGGSGWKPVGTFTFDGLGDEYIAVHDAEATAPGSEQHIAFDAIQLSRVGAWCGNGTCDGDEDCGDCAQDCTGPAELPGNGVDDDCNGEVDEEDPTPEPTPGDDDATADDDSAGDDDSARGRQPPIEGRRRAEVVPAAACGSCSPAALPLVGLPLGWTRRRRAAVR
jgi:hypothetical protein